MINLLIYLGLFAVLVAIAILSRAGAYIFTQIKANLNFKPFNCHGCLPLVNFDVGVYLIYKVCF